MNNQFFNYFQDRYSADQVNYTWPKYNTPLQGGAGFNVPEYFLTSSLVSQTTAQTSSGRNGLCIKEIKEKDIFCVPVYMVPFL